jgi:hypothetical protein
MEEWRPVVGYEGAYEVSSRGRVRSLDKTLRHPNGATWTRPGRLLNPCPGPQGYLQVTLSRGGHCKTFHVHRLVAAAFIGPRPPGQVVRHRDGVKANCAVDNIAYGTSLQNSDDARQHGTLCQGSSHGSAKLTDDQVRAIRAQRYVKKERELAAEYGVSHQLIHKIHTRFLWKHLDR